MKRILSAAVALAAFATAQQAYAVDFCVGSTNTVDNLGTGSQVGGNGGPVAGKCNPGGVVNQRAQNQSFGGFFTVTGNIANGVINAAVGRSGIGAGDPITDRFIFVVPQTGFGSGALTTSGVKFDTVDLDFLSVSINGVLATLTSTDIGNVNFEAAFAGVPIFIGVKNVLEVTYKSRGDGSYGGNLAFVPVPEPTTWALMLAGFGAIGFGMRRRNKPQPKVRFAF